MSIELIIYLVGVLDAMGLFQGLALFSLILSAICLPFIYGWEQEIEGNGIKTFKEIATKTFKWSALFLVLNAFIPTQKTAYLMLGTHFGKEVIQSETASKVQRIIDGKLDEYLKELEK